MLCKAEDRYQFQPWYIKLWRRRYQLTIPYYATKSWWRSLNNHEPISFRFAWDIAIGTSHIAMGWWISAEEWKELENETRTTKKDL